MLTEAQRVRRFVAAAASRVCLATERDGYELHPSWRDLLRTARRHTVHPLLLRDLDAAYDVARVHFHSMSGGHWSCWYLVKTALLRDACMTPDDGRSFVFALEKVMEVTRHRWQGARELRRWVREQVPRLGLAWPLADDERLRDDPKEHAVEQEDGGEAMKDATEFKGVFVEPQEDREGRSIAYASEMVQRADVVLTRGADGSVRVLKDRTGKLLR